AAAPRPDPGDPASAAGCGPGRVSAGRVRASVADAAAARTGAGGGPLGAAGRLRWRPRHGDHRLSPHRDQDAGPRADPGARREDRMTSTLTIERRVHFDRRGHGARKELQAGPAPVRPVTVGRVPRVARLLALAHRLEALIRTG